MMWRMKFVKSLWGRKPESDGLLANSKTNREDMAQVLAALTRQVSELNDVTANLRVVTSQISGIVRKEGTLDVD